MSMIPKPLLLLAVLALAPGLARGAEAPDPATVLAALRASRLAPEARRVENVELAVGPATVRLERGWLFAVVAPDGTPIPELVFRGRGRLALSPEEAIEATQLENFTGAPELDQEFTEAVLVIADGAVTAPLRAAPVSPEGAAEATAAQALHDRWRTSRERQLLGVPGALWRIGLGETPFEPYFAGAFATTDHGRVLLLIDPESDEQLTLGRFAPLDFERAEERKLRRQLHRAQRRGRLVGLELADLGPWDTWVSLPLANHGRATFEPSHYGLQVAVAKGGELRGTLRAELTATAGGARSVAFRLPPETKIAAVRDGSGQSVPYALEEGSLVAILPTAPAGGETTNLEIDFSGPFLVREDSARSGGDLWYLPDSVNWYPHTGTIDRATYEVDVTADWGVIVAPGAATDTKPGPRGHFLLSRPTFGFTFEVGRFETFSDTTGEIPITLYLDSAWRDYDLDGKQLVTDLRSALAYLEEIFGPLPFDHLTAVTTPRSYSQSFPGHLVLADFMMIRLPWISDDPRTVMSHELAHQWWGHKVGFSRYRDQWLSEALATFASVLYGREKLERRLQGNAMDRWQDVLTSITANGLPLESLGPVVLGGRLDSSLADAYAPIVYWKGALVVDMIQNLYGPKTFTAALRKILTGEQGGDMTTEEFLAGLELHAGGDLDELAARFIFGVGLPEMYYSYRFETLSPGKWAVVGTARQQAPYHYRYRLAERPGQLPDVVRETVEKAPVSNRSSLAVPVEIGIYQPDAPPPTAKLNRAARREWDQRVAEEGNAVVKGRTVLQGSEAGFRFEIAYEPRRLWFDRHEEVYCRFYDERRFPKRTALYRGIDLAAAGRFEAAEAAFREALTAPLSTDPPPADDDPFTRRTTRLSIDQLDRWARQRLARLLLDSDRLAEAETTLEESKEGDRGHMPLWQKHDERTLEARLALRKGDPERALDLLSGGFNKLAVESREGQALLAVAAWALSDEKTLTGAKKAAEKGGIDLSLLDRPRD